MRNIIRIGLKNHTLVKKNTIFVNYVVNNITPKKNKYRMSFICFNKIIVRKYNSVAYLKDENLLLSKIYIQQLLECTKQYLFNKQLYQDISKCISFLQQNEKSCLSSLTQINQFFYYMELNKLLKNQAELQLKMTLSKKNTDLNIAHVLDHIYSYLYNIINEDCLLAKNILIINNITLTKNLQEIFYALYLLEFKEYIDFIYSSRDLLMIIRDNDLLVNFWYSQFLMNYMNLRKTFFLSLNINDTIIEQVQNQFMIKHKFDFSILMYTLNSIKDAFFLCENEDRVFFNTKYRLYQIKSFFSEFKNVNVCLGKNDLGNSDILITLIK